MSCTYLHVTNVPMSDRECASTTVARRVGEGRESKRKRERERERDPDRDRNADRFS